MFERFNEQGRQAIVLAQDEARSLGHDHIGSEHMLLGLLRLDDELVELFGDPADVRRRVVEIVGEGEHSGTGQIPFTANAKRLLELAVREAEGSMVGSLQLALALLALPGDATAVRALRVLGVSVSDTREEILGLGSQRPATSRGGDEPGRFSDASRRVIETAARHAEDSAIGPEHLLLALVLEVPELTSVAIGTADGGIVSERLSGLLEGPEPTGLRTPRRDIAALEVALRLAADAGREEVSPVDILLGLLEVAPDVVARAAVDLHAVAERSRRFADPSLLPRLAPRVPARSELPLAGFSEGAHEVLRVARDEAQRLGHSYIGTEHLLLALVQDERGVAGRVLAGLGVELDQVRDRVEHIVPREDDSEHLAGDGRGSCRSRRGCRTSSASRSARWRSGRARPRSTPAISCSRSSGMAKASPCGCSSRSAHRRTWFAAGRSLPSTRTEPTARGRQQRRPATRLPQVRDTACRWPSQRASETPEGSDILDLGTRRAPLRESSRE